MNEKEYKTYLKSPHWKYVSERAKIESGNKCSLCGTNENLCVHHNNYFCLYHEINIDLIVLCNRCHMKFHDIVWKKSKKIINLNPQKRNQKQEAYLINYDILTIETTERGDNYKNSYIHIVYDGAWSVHSGKSYMKLSISKKNRINDNNFNVYQQAFTIMSRIDPRNEDLSILKYLKKMTSLELRNILLLKGYNEVDLQNIEKLGKMPQYFEEM